MTNKNIEIIEEELKKYLSSLFNGMKPKIYFIEGENTEKNIKQFATTLLAKLNIPEEGITIAEGELFLSQDSGITMIKNTKFINVDEKLYKYQGKKGRLVFIEDKIINDNKGGK